LSSISCARTKEGFPKARRTDFSELTDPDVESIKAALPGRFKARKNEIEPSSQGTGDQPP